jgi:hypothetical protein
MWHYANNFLSDIKVHKERERDNRNEGQNECFKHFVIRQHYTQCKNENDGGHDNDGRKRKKNE